MNTNFHKLALLPLSLHICIQQAIKDLGWEWLGNEATCTHTHTLPEVSDSRICGEVYLRQWTVSSVEKKELTRPKTCL